MKFISVILLWHATQMLLTLHSTRFALLMIALHEGVATDKCSYMTLICLTCYVKIDHLPPIAIDVCNLAKHIVRCASVNIFLFCSLSIYNSSSHTLLVCSLVFCSRCVSYLVVLAACSGFLFHLLISYTIAASGNAS